MTPRPAGPPPRHSTATLQVRHTLSSTAPGGGAPPPRSPAAPASPGGGCGPPPPPGSEEGADMPSVPSLARDESQAQTRRALTECRSGPSLVPAPAVRLALAPPWQSFCRGALQLE